MSDLREAAKQLAAKGLSVFKLRPNSKIPVQKGFYDRATNRQDIVESVWTDADGEPERYNIGVLTGALLPCGHRLHVIDVDNKPTRSGWAALDDLKLLGLNDETLTVRTPSGGLHLYYCVPSDWPELSSTANLLGDGIDTRGYHGYVVGPGSSLDGKSYEIIKDAEIALLEDWFLEHLRPRRELKADSSRWLCEPDLDANIQRAVEHIARYPVPDEGRRNDQMHKLALDVRDFGVSDALAVELIAQHWPLLQDESLFDELDKTVRSAYRSAALPAGRFTADAQLEDLSDQLEPDAVKTPAQIAKARFTFETIDDVLLTPDITWLVNGWIPEGQPGMFYGPSGSYKSFVALDLALHLAHGWEHWHGTAIPGVPCNVLVIASEGRAGHKKRIRAFNKHHGVETNPKSLQFMRADVNFMRDSDFKGLCDAIKDLGMQFRLIVVDTVQRVTAGVDSNTQEAVGLFMERCRKLGAAAGNAATLAVHHTNKTGGLLGSGVFKNESDFLFKVERGPDRTIELFCEKLKDDEDNWTIHAGIEELRFGDAEHDKSMVLTGLGERTETSPSQTDPPKRGNGSRAPKGFDDAAKVFFDQIEQAWDEGRPYHDNTQTRLANRNIIVRAMTVMRVQRSKAKSLVDGWVAEGHIEHKTRDSHSKQKGYAVLSRPWDVAE